jgi:hypothetical protein
MSDYDEESYMAGASASLNKSIKDIENLSRLSTSGKSHSGPLRQRFREKLLKELLDVGFGWYRIGFKRGHKTSRDIFKKKGVVPKKISKRVHGTIKGQEFGFKLRSDLTKRG